MIRPAGALRHWLKRAFVAMAIAVPLVGGTYLIVLGGVEHQRHQEHMAWVAEALSHETGLDLAAPDTHTVMRWESQHGVIACRYTPVHLAAGRVERHVCSVPAALAKARAMRPVLKGPKTFEILFRTRSQ